ncbi:MAG: NADH-quinone oxidoreductase subunit H, partial [Granulosicoccus sp.]|nr:NADH-quinone oxidoreductase subunit H [Granulosicoccus sp.]
MIAALAAILFLGGWLSPIDGVGDGVHWFLIKTASMLFLFLWLRATFPRYRYDQIMRLGWKVFIPVTIVWIAVVGFAIYFEVGPWFSSVRSGGV